MQVGYYAAQIGHLIISKYMILMVKTTHLVYDISLFAGNWQGEIK